MKTITLSLLIFALHGCSYYSNKDNSLNTDPTNQPENQEVSSDASTQCIGNTTLPKRLKDKFEVLEDKALLDSALGEPEKGKLCQGQVYQSKAGSDITIYRAWNSTNPNSEKGKWWASQRPKGKVLQYRSDYEICYQWSPLDKLTHCKLKPGSKVVIGTGQSAKCSEYLTYPVSAAKQIYIADASTAVSDCKVYDGVFKWKNDSSSKGTK